MSEAPAFSGRAVAALVGVGFASFVGFVLLLAFSGGPVEADGQAHAASRSAVGFAGIVQLLREAGTPVRLSRAPAYASGGAAGQPRSGLLVLTPEAGLRGPGSMPALAARTVLIVLPKWSVSRAAEHAGWVEPEGLLPESEVLGVLPADWPRPMLHRRAAAEHPALRATAPLGAAPATAGVSRLQTIEGPGWTAVLADGDGGIVLGRRGEGPYVLADPDLVNDLALAELSGASGAVTLLASLADGEPIAFDVSLNGFGRSRDLLRLIFEPPLLGATLCAVAAAALIGLLSVRRFGPARRAGRAIDAGKRALADNSAGLIALARREPRMARPYAELMRSLAARTSAAPRHLTTAELDAYLDRAGSIRALPDRFSGLLAEADAVRDRAGLMQLAARLHHWRMGLIHGHR